MKKTMTAVAAIGVLAMLGAAPSAGQAQWDSMDVQGGGKQFQLNNDDGSAIRAPVPGQRAGRGIPVSRAESSRRTGPPSVARPAGGRTSSVAQVAAQLLQVVGARGRDFTLDMLQSASRLSVRAAGQDARLRGLRERIDRQGVHRTAGVPDRGPAAAILRRGT